MYTQSQNLFDNSQAAYKCLNLQKTKTCNEKYVRRKFYKDCK